MNKYQEALNRVNKAITVALACQGIDLKEDNETVLALKALQELVDKETPKKVIRGIPSCCPSCKWRTSMYQKYCDDCGQKLDWGD